MSGSASTSLSLVMSSSSSLYSSTASTLQSGTAPATTTAESDSKNTSTHSSTKLHRHRHHHTGKDLKDRVSEKPPVGAPTVTLPPYSGTARPNSKFKDELPDILTKLKESEEHRKHSEKALERTSSDEESPKPTSDQGYSAGLSEESGSESSNASGDDEISTDTAGKYQSLKDRVFAHRETKRKLKLLKLGDPATVAQKSNIKKDT